MAIVYLKVDTYIQLHYLQVAIATPKGGIAILRSLLTDNLPSSGKVSHPPPESMSPHSFQTVVWVLLHPTRTR